MLMSPFVMSIALLLFSSFACAQKLSGVVKAGGPSAVVLEPVVAKAFSAPTQTVTMDQRGLKFTPSLLVIQQGTTVEFRNSDTVSHNIFWPNISGNKKLAHNLGTAASGQTQRFKFENLGNVPILCNIHPEMSANVVVSPSPYFAQTDAAGTYSINDIPEGAYKATAWHNGKATTVSVTVKGDTRVDFAPPMK
jgi:plastocyanin